MKTYDKTKYFQITDDGKTLTSEIVKRLREKFEVWVYDEKTIDKHCPPPQEPTTRYFLRVVEADEANKNKSADDLDRTEHITLRERLLMELDYFNETGEHLDVQNWTLCSGSRRSDGSVPGVGWYPDDRRLDVHWAHRFDRRDYLLSRSAVSLKSSEFNLSDLESRVARIENWIMRVKDQLL